MPESLGVRPRVFLSPSLDPRVNLACEEHMLERVPDGACWLYLWQNERTVVVGRNQNPWQECRVDELERDGGRLVRRPSGGGAVYHDRGNLNYTFLLPSADFDLERLLGCVLAAIRALGIPAEFSGRNDLLADGRKFSGTAHYHGRRTSLLHGTLLVDSDLERLVQYLRVSDAKIASKGIASVRSRVVNLAECVDGLAIAAVQRAVVDAFTAEWGGSGEPEVLEPTALAIEEFLEKYGSWEWTFGRTPRFEVEWRRRFPWGEVCLGASLKNGRLQDARLYTDALAARPFPLFAEALLGCALEATALRRGLARVELADAQEAAIRDDLAGWFASVAG